jgi:hypothetical protein
VARGLRDEGVETLHAALARHVERGEMPGLSPSCLRPRGALVDEAEVERRSSDMHMWVSTLDSPYDRCGAADSSVDTSRLAKAGIRG